MLKLTIVNYFKILNPRLRFARFVRLLARYKLFLLTYLLT